MSSLKRMKTGLILLCIALLFSVSLPIYNTPSYAAVPKLEQIRVALFIDSIGTVPTATLSSASGLTIGVRQPNGVKPWVTIPQNQSVRVSMDQYKLQVLETSDYNAARSMYKQLEQGSNKPYLFSIHRHDKTIYQVQLGSFATKELALQAKDKLSASDTASVVGPFHWNAGTYTTEAEAEAQLVNLTHHGLDAYLVYHEGAQGKLAYSVWCGAAGDQIQLDRVKAQATDSLPKLALQAIDPNQPYLLKRMDLSLASSSSETTTHYFFNGNEQKVWISSNQPAIKVSERSGRTYRGSIELSRYNGSMAVINELPFESYLYSVVGSELSEGWPTEVLKAQAVAARTYALQMGLKYKIAHISDTTLDQVYHGVGREFKGAVQAVDATAGEVLVDKAGQLIAPFYSSNSGGLTSDSLEVWGTPLNYIKSVPSPDEDAQKGKLAWYRVVLQDGQIGYIRSDLVRETGEHNSIGLPYLEVQESASKIRSAPYVDDVGNPAITQLNIGDRLITFEQAIESNSFSWIRGSYPSDVLLRIMNRNVNTPITGNLETLEVTERGPSGRVMMIEANGRELKVSRPDAYRTAMNSLPSTRFDIEEMGKYTILGSNGRTRSLPTDKGPLHVLSGSGNKVATESATSHMSAQQVKQSTLFFMNDHKELRLATRDPQFRFIGLGYGHGLGMSQWGARSWAELGYDYQGILEYYYQDIRIVKGEL